MASATAGRDVRTTYRVVDGRGNVSLLLDAERAERLSRSGLTVTAVSECVEVAR